jgi:hypothetical protein
MKLSSKTLGMTAVAVLGCSTLVYGVAATVGLIASHHWDVAIRALTVMAWCVIGWLMAGLLFVIAWLVKWREDHPRPSIRVQLLDKPPGWNRDVLHWFFAGPEGRVKGPEFREGWRKAADRGALCVI